MPSLNLLENCSRSIAQYLPELQIKFKPKIINNNCFSTFIETNWDNILSFLHAKFPSAQGWMANSYWQFIEENNSLDIFLGTAMGVKYLTKHGCIRYLEELFNIIIDNAPAISLKVDETIQKVIIDRDVTDEVLTKQSCNNKAFFQ